MAARKTLEDYQIEEIARGIIDDRLRDFSQNVVPRGEYDLHVTNKNNAIESIQRDIGVLQNSESERQKDKKTLKFQIIGIAMGFVFQFIIWVVSFSNGFRVGGDV